MSDIEDIEEIKLTYEELLAENTKLKNKCDELTKENKKLKNKINDIRDYQGYEICEYFNDCDSLKATAEHFLYDDIVECGEDLIHFNGCSDAIQSASDYKEYYRLAYGKDYNSDDSDSDSDSDSNNKSEK